MHDVPDAGDDAVRDPNLDGLYAQRLLPAWYQPAAMPTQVRGWRRVAAWTVVAMLLVTVTAGICLTFGPDEMWRVLGTT
ncbi:hypothetical protein [Euzebya sp.]|uniref:hypothetical protein n=1 Tax=Euzebya sp. TaxID=1971409 RepID=UPI0035143F9A